MTEALVLPGHEGTITVAASALELVVVRAAESVEGARVRKPKRTVEVAHEPGRASVSFELAIERGGRVLDLAAVVQEEKAVQEEGAVQEEAGAANKSMLE